MNSMNTETDLLYQLILLYREKLDVAIGFLNEKTNRDKDFHIIHKSGFLDEYDKVAFSFHGRGCTISMDDVSLSIDFDEDGRCDGFEAWVLGAFLYHNKTVKSYFSTIDSFKKIKLLLEELKADGLLYTKDFLISGPMYLLPKDFFSVNPLKWIQNN